MSCPKCVMRNARMMGGGGGGGRCGAAAPSSLDDPYQKMLAERAKQDTMWVGAESAAPATRTFSERSGPTQHPAS